MKVLLFALLYSGVSFSSTQMGSRWNELMSLINQEMKILNSARRKGPELYYRMLELHSEKLKLIHQKNNKDFLDKSKVVNVSGQKENYFQESRQYYAMTKDFGLKILKDYPQTNRRAEVKFAMAINSRDYGKDNITEKYLLDTISLLPDINHPLRHHAETALADFYYNEKKFNDAIKYYQRVIKRTQDEWLPKHTFNLSWCYLKVREFDKAINTIKESYFLSQKNSYVSVKDQALDNIGAFYVYAGRALEGLDFYLKHEKDPFPYLTPMARKAWDKGYQKESEVILSEAQKIIDKNEWKQYQEELFHAYLDFYRQYNRFDDHEKVSQKLVTFYRTAEDEKIKVHQKDDAIEKMRSLAGFLQVKLIKDMKEDHGQYDTKELQIVLSFFIHLIELDHKRKVEYFYFRGETYYSIRRFQDSAPAYVECVNEAKSIKNDEYSRKALNSLLALTGQEVLPKEENKKFIIFAYSEHLALWPRDPMSEKIYPKLFEVYRDGFEDEKGVALLHVFNKNYPEHLKDQQVLMTKILDQFIDKKNTVKLAHAIQDFKGGFLSFPKETIEKTEITLGNMLFMEYQGMAKKGDKKEAAIGFEEIYDNKLYTDKVKSQSAFFAALTYLELADTDKSYSWLRTAWEKMTPEEKAERREEQLKITERTYKLQDFKTSHLLARDLLKEYCTKKDKTQDRFYQVAVMTAMVEEEVGDAYSVIKKHSDCLSKSSLKEEALSQIYHYYDRRGDLSHLKDFVKENSLPEFLSQYPLTLQRWYWERSDQSLKSKVKKEYKNLNTSETLTWLEEVEKFEAAQKKMNLMSHAEIWNKDKFDGNLFNQALEGYLVEVQKFKNDYQSLTQSRQLDLALMSTKLLADMYQMSGEKIRDLSPAGMDAQMIKDFKGAMKQVGGQLISAARQYNKNLDKAVKDKERLSVGGRSVASLERVENPVMAFLTGITMDKSDKSKE